MVETLLIDSETVRSNIDPSNLVNQIEEGFANEHRGKAYNPEREQISTGERSEILSMPARLADGSVGMKWVSDFLDNEDVPPVMGTVIYNDKQDGKPLAIIDGTELTRIRTGCAAAIGSKYLTDKKPSSIGIIGLGAQSEEVLRYHGEIFDLDTIYASDIDDSAYEEFVQKFEQEYDIRRCEGTECIKKSDAITTVTPTTSPIINSATPPTHINALGADMPQKQEISKSVLSDPETTLVTDDKRQSKTGGEFSSIIESNTVNLSEIQKLGHIIDDKKLADQLKSNLTVFDSTGLGIQDVVSARMVYESVDKDQCQTFEFF